jgi:cobalt-zinc-cadmium efflux system protein
LSWVLALNLFLIIGLVVTGLAAGSLGVLAAAGDTAADASAITLGLLAVHLRNRRDKAQAPTYVAGLNASLLLIVVIYVSVEAVHRLTTGSPPVHGLPTLIASAVAMLVMLGCAAILGRTAADEDLNMHSVLLDTLADALAAAGVAVVGTFILVTGRLFWLDSLVAMLIGAVIGVGSVRLLGEVVSALRHGEPMSIAGD